MHRIAIFRALHLGDMLCAIPAIRALRKVFPRSEMTLISLSWCSDFPERFPSYLDAFLEFPSDIDLTRTFKIVYQHPFFEATREEKFDLVFQMHGAGTISNAVVQKLGAKNTFGFSRGRDARLTRTIPYPDQGTEPERLAAIPKAFGAEHIDLSLEYPLLPHEERMGATIQSAIRRLCAKYVCIHPGARDPRRRWDAKHFGKVARELQSNGYAVVITGTKEEETEVRAVASELDEPIVLLQYPLGIVAAVIKDAELLITNDTGISHLGAAMRTSSIVLFSDVSEKSRWTPWAGERHVVVDSGKATAQSIFALAREKQFI